MFFNVNYTGNDSISFYRKVSTEAGWDYLKFFIDNVEKEKWAGELDWGRQTYPVAAGNHSFQWSYEKDGLVSEGEDAAYVDFILLGTGEITAIANKSSLLQHWRLYPNPAKHTVQLDFERETQTDVCITFYDIQGKIQSSHTCSPHETTWTETVNEWASGIYFVKLQIGDSFAVQKLIVE
jgi:hypothetical protein